MGRAVDGVDVVVLRIDFSRPMQSIESSRPAVQIISRQWLESVAQMAVGDIKDVCFGQRRVGEWHRIVSIQKLFAILCTFAEIAIAITLSKHALGCHGV